MPDDIFARREKRARRLFSQTLNERRENARPSFVERQKQKRRERLEQRRKDQEEIDKERRLERLRLKQDDERSSSFSSLRSKPRGILSRKRF